MGLKFGIHIMRGVPRLAVHQHLPVKGADTPATRLPRTPPSAGGTRICTASTPAGRAQAYYDSILGCTPAGGVDYVKVDDICNTNAYPNDPYSGEKEIRDDPQGHGPVRQAHGAVPSPGPAVIDKAWHLRQNANMWRITEHFWDQ